MPGRCYIQRMEHFEDIWNEAEQVSEKMTHLIVDDVVKQLHSKIDKLADYANMPKEQAVNIGEILFDLAAIASITERRNSIGVNVAAGMKSATESNKEKLNGVQNIVNSSLLERK